jgi:hypothetical protein
MRILFIGDVQGQANIMKLYAIVSRIKRDMNINLVIINGENSAEGNGITPKSAEMLFNAGADVITTGNHAFKRKEMNTMFNERAEILRPANYGCSCPGHGMYVIDFGYCELCVVNIMGMSYMPPCDNPFRCIDEILEKVSTPNIVIDFHGEATAEKKAFAYYLSMNKRASAVWGTHTHVQTADEQILNEHTAFISDVGMVGGIDSVIGAGKEEAVKVFSEYYPQKYKFAEGATEFNAVVTEIDTKTGQALSIERIKQTI